MGVFGDNLGNNCLQNCHLGNCWFYDRKFRFTVIRERNDVRFNQTSRYIGACIRIKDNFRDFSIKHILWVLIRAASPNRTEEKYPLIVSKYPPNLFHWQNGKFLRGKISLTVNINSQTMNVDLNFIKIGNGFK